MDVSDTGTVNRTRVPSLREADHLPSLILHGVETLIEVDRKGYSTGASRRVTMRYNSFVLLGGRHVGKASLRDSGRTDVRGIGPLSVGSSYHWETS